MLTKKSATAATSARRLRGAAARQLGQTMDRRAFLKRSGLGVGAGALATQLPYNFIGAADAAAPAGVSRAEGKAEIRRTVCTHCSVGCAADAVVRNGVWVHQEPVFDSPINLGSHCAKGAALREHGHGEYRLKYPMKLVDGKYQKISWEQALNEVGDRLLKIREESGPDAVYFIGSSKHNNEQAYLLRKFVSFWGTNNCDHQARICHSTTVAGVANTWGYGAMTNSYNDMQNAKAMLFIGSNAAEAHPVSLLHILHAKENGAKMIVVDPRFTRTAAKAHQYIRIRSGTDVPFLFGLLYHIFQNGWEDKQYIDDRVFGMDKIREEVLAKWTPDKVEEACGVPEDQMLLAARTMADVLLWPELQRWEAHNSGFQSRLALSRESVVERAQDHAGRIREVDLAAALQHLGDSSTQSASVYVCGSNAFVESAITMLRALQVPDQAIRTERFGG